MKINTKNIQLKSILCNVTTEQLTQAIKKVNPALPQIQ